MDSLEARAQAALTRRSSLSGLLVLALVAWLLATGRWGSYVGVPGLPIYISEMVMVVVGLAALVEHWRLAPPADVSRATFRRWAWFPLMGLVAWSVVRLVVGGPASVDGLRDFAPYGYAVVTVASVLRPVRTRIAVPVVLAALVAHTAWVAAAHYALLPEALPTLGRTSLFTIRADFDGAVCGVTAAWCVFLATRFRARHAWIGLLALAAANLLLVFSLLSRAGLLAAFTALVFLALSVARPVRTWARGSLRNLGIAALVTLAVLGGATTLTVTSATGARLLSTFDFSEHRAEVGGAAAAGGTTKARLQVYDKVVRYTGLTPGRLMFGVGFGPNFLKDSGAAPLLEGTTFRGVRAPHNILVNSLARLGILGALLHLAVLVAGAALAGRFFLDRRTHPLGALCATVVVALPVAALLGVILESPFAAIPYFWCFGWLAMKAPVTPAIAIRIGGAHRRAKGERVLETGSATARHRA